MKYCSIRFEMGDHDHEIWQALLGEWPFESLLDEDDAVTGYITENFISAELIEYLKSTKGNFFEKYSIESIPEKNWNELWESSFPPIAVEDFCYIRASFHPIPQRHFKHSITIAPKMAFGTGHHATTFMMIRAMSTIDFRGLNVLDFGCGTGILSVVAAKEGASHVVGVDIQKEAVENSIEHALLNQVKNNCEFHLGTLEDAPGIFHVILANIDRNTIIANLDGLDDRMTPGSYLLISGILAKDYLEVETALISKDLKITDKSEKDDWLQLVIQKH